jgi:hypothetical protein
MKTSSGSGEYRDDINCAISLKYALRRHFVTTRMN